MTEYGLFNDEGCVASGFYSQIEADKFANDHFDKEDYLEILEICPDHHDEARNYCSICNQEE